MTSALGFDLLRPGAGVWLLAAPACLALGLWGLAARRRALARFVEPAQVARFVPRFSPSRARARVVLGALAVLFTALALVGPVRGYSLRDVQRRGIDLVVCLDTSRSMLVQDQRPDRLTRAKREVQGLLQRLTGDRVALLAFAGDVRVSAPLTHDRNTLAHFVDTLTPDDNLVGGTNLGAALERALALFDGRTGAHEAVVMLTDGEDLEEQGLAMAKKAAERGIRVYVVGMGTEAGGKIPDGSGGFVRDEAGREVVSTMKDATLRQIAETTGGTYLAASASAVPLEELYDKRISRIETRELWAGKERIPHDRFQWPLVLALGCMLVEAGLRERRPASARERRMG